MVRWHGSALPGDAERVCVYVGHPALPARNQGPPHSQHLKQIDRCFSFFLQPPLPPVLVHALPGTGSTSPSPPEKPAVGLLDGMWELHRTWRPYTREAWSGDTPFPFNWPKPKFWNTASGAVARQQCE
ncbi:uncharacterized protein LOC120605063 isoform X2 [Pteropus medius]|uniref:uncharacterized protein LOC120605063 isoform X2 n=1 Tax=Pteropus vampyrus TaxID=132908 RepID=UPI00196A3351|nr:uncharacterized protein LOC120605063 isoform X2 [Pteropus giganteus]